MEERHPRTEQDIVNATSSADLFMTQDEQDAMGRYLDIFASECERLGPGHDDEALSIAQTREPNGYEANVRWNKMYERFLGNEEGSLGSVNNS